MSENRIADDLMRRYPLLTPTIHADLIAAYKFIRETFQNGGKILIAGNGGSAADAAHIVGELMKSFKLNRPCREDLRKKLMGFILYLGHIGDYQPARETVPSMAQVLPTKSG